MDFVSVQGRADFHQDISIAQLPSRVPGKLKARGSYSRHWNTSKTRGARPWIISRNSAIWCLALTMLFLKFVLPEVKQGEINSGKLYTYHPGVKWMASYWALCILSLAIRFTPGCWLSISPPQLLFLPCFSLLHAQVVWRKTLQIAKIRRLQLQVYKGDNTRHLRYYVYSKLYYV